MIKITNVKAIQTENGIEYIPFNVDVDYETKVHNNIVIINHNNLEIHIDFSMQTIELINL